MKSPFSRPLYVMAKPAGSACNMACSYCYYLDKQRFYNPDDSRYNMSDEMLDLFVKRYFEAQTEGEVLFTWHGGETLLRPLSFYKKAEGAVCLTAFKPTAPCSLKSGVGFCVKTDGL